MTDGSIQPKVDLIDGDGLLAQCGRDYAALHRLWTVKRGARAMPARADFAFEEFRPWLGRLALIDVIDGGRDFRYRLIGCALIPPAAPDLTGRLASRTPYSGTAAQALANMRAVAESGRPRWRCDPLPLPGEGWEVGERLLLPLGRDGARCDRILYLGEILRRDDRWSV